jgi:transglutaminase-like putative cysteine protease
MVLGAGQPSADGADRLVVKVTRRYRIRHATTYSYGSAMTDGYTVGVLAPRNTAHQRLRSYRLEVDPEADELDERVDQFGNRITQLGLHHPHERLEVVSVAEVDVDSPDEPRDDRPWEEVVEIASALTGDDAIEIRPFRAPSRHVDTVVGGALGRLVGETMIPGEGIVDAARRLCTTIFETFEFDPTFTEVSTPVAQVAEARRGVCQDFAHLALAVLRSVGLPARYVSGYIETEAPAGSERLVGADASHAWCAVWTPGDGWIDLDPTNGHLPVSRHVTVAWGRDYADVAPVRGVVIGPASEQRLDVAVDVASEAL